MLINENNISKILVFYLENHSFGLNAENIVTVFRNPSIKAVSNLPDPYIGFYDYNKTSLIVIDMRFHFWGKKTDLLDDLNIIIIKIQNKLSALMVQKVSDLFNFNSNDIIEHSPYGKFNRTIPLSSIVKSNKHGNVQILDKQFYMSLGYVKI